MTAHESKLKYVRYLFNIWCYTCEQLLRIVGIIIIIILSPILVPALFITEAFSNDVRKPYREGDRWWFEWMNKRDKYVKEPE